MSLQTVGTRKAEFVGGTIELNLPDPEESGHRMRALITRISGRTNLVVEASPIAWRLDGTAWFPWNGGEPLEIVLNKDDYRLALARHGRVRLDARRRHPREKDYIVLRPASCCRGC
ncbi:MAG TPA: hypothetical protein VMC43_03040 [Candidatus Paceibacterota bacterium]|nr:hypothetical protein [Candidatus Paceibacterota bacterium]